MPFDGIAGVVWRGVGFVNPAVPPVAGRRHRVLEIADGVITERR